MTRFDRVDFESFALICGIALAMAAVAVVFLALYAIIPTGTGSWQDVCRERGGQPVEHLLDSGGICDCGDFPCEDGSPP